MAEAVERDREAIHRHIWGTMPDRVRFARPAESRWFKHLPEGWRERVVLVTIHDFEKQDWVEPHAERYIVRCRPVFKMFRPGEIDPGAVVPIIEKSMLFERSQDKREDGMTIFREVPT